ncbi:DoxX family protein [Longimicrobium sp.]|uniref:DoxX family protein n=1 Tax=Longimicrobium sp. TaxID=2029185 RepID=UPI002CB46288|nr:DoxX family protein [Longimicrobium sp.]HSU14346.1 DoxX family protein [Longimicrobium sp.]
MPTLTQTSKKASVLLWTVQALLAALFLFAGVMKLVMPIEAMARPVAFPGWFLRFIGVCETLGAIGLVLPALLRIRPSLTPLAAAGLVVIMCGAVVVTLQGGAIAPALVPFVVGLLAAYVAWGRTRIAPIQPSARRRAVLQPAS